MNKEEIEKALEIIKKPITVNCEEYKYFDQENYNNLISVYENCLWIVNLFEQVKENIEPIQLENQKLKGYKEAVIRFMKYLEENKMHLNNPNIFGFYMEIKEAERNENNQ